MDFSDFIWERPYETNDPQTIDFSPSLPFLVFFGYVEVKKTEFNSVRERISHIRSQRALLPDNA